MAGERIVCKLLNIFLPRHYRSAQLGQRQWRGDENRGMSRPGGSVAAN